MNILITIETLQPGGAEWFALRLADALQKQGHRIVIWVLRRDLMDKRLLNKFEGLQIHGIPALLTRFLARIDRVSERIGALGRWVQRVNAKAMQSYIREFRPDAIHSNLMKTDQVVIAARKGFSFPIVITVHGDYINFYNRTTIDKQTAYKQKIGRLLKDVDAIAVISGKQERFFLDVLGVPAEKIHRIYNGYPDVQATSLSVADSSIVTFGMVARGIPEKGWLIAIDAFIAADIPGARLVLVGESEYLDGLKAANQNPMIVFRPFTTEPLEEIAGFDVGLLPSWYGSESLPTTIIEYLALGKPVIASNAGEIAEMILTAEGPAGIIVPLTNEPSTMVKGVCEAMQALADNHVLRTAMRSRAKNAFEAFRMDRCTAAYVDLYQCSRS